jgi:hypothetical protein
MPRSGSVKDPARDCWPTGGSARDCTLPDGTAGTGGVASAVFPPNGLANGLSENRVASELQAAASVPMRIASAKRGIAPERRNGFENPVMVSQRIGLPTSHATQPQG